MALLVISAIFILFFSFSTSPIYQNFGLDSLMFQVIGKSWADGGMPYIDTWDQKGPLIFFINMLGYRFTGSAIGIFILQIFFLWLSLCFVYKTCRLYFSRRVSVLLVLFYLLWIPRTFTCGNMTEEYCMPFICASFYLICRWLCNVQVNDRYSHPWTYSIIYGLTFGVCLLTRVTNATGVCASVLIIVIVLAQHRMWKNLIHNSLGWLAGASAVCLPFILYFAENGALYDMLYGTILYNIDYASSSIPKNFWSGLPLDIIKQWPCSTLILSCIISYIYGGRTAKLPAILFSFTAITTFLYLHNSRGYEHYTQIASPYIVISVIFLIKSDLHRWIKAASVCVYGLVATIASYTTVRLLLSYYSTDNLRVESALNLLSNATPPRLKISDLTCWDADPGIYLRGGYSPSFRFFTLQSSMANIGNSLHNIMYYSFEQEKPEWLLISGDLSTKSIAPIVENDYVAVKSNGDYTLYHLIAGTPHI